MDVRILDNVKVRVLYATFNKSVNALRDYWHSENDVYQVVFILSAIAINHISSNCLIKGMASGG